MNKRFLPAYKIAFGFAALAVLATYGYRYGNDLMLGSQKMPPIKPGVVNIVGVNTAAGYRIVVQNQLAKLVLGPVGTLGVGKMDEGMSDDGPKKFVPIKEMLQSLKGDDQALAQFVMRINEVNEDEWPSTAPLWKASDIQRALNGDASLKTKLERDLNMRLDGTPLDRVSKNAIFSGILVETEVPVRVGTGEFATQRVARIHDWFRPNFISRLTDVVLKEKNYDLKELALRYQLEAKQLAGAQKQDIAAALRGLYSQERVASMAKLPEQIMGSVEVVVNDDLITDASSSEKDGAKGKIYDLNIKVNDEGRRRLWQFTRDRVGSQLLVTMNGVAIAAPYIEHGISDNEAQITKLEDYSLVEEAIATIKESRAKK